VPGDFSGAAHLDPEILVRFDEVLDWQWEIMNFKVKCLGKMEDVVVKEEP